MSEKIKETIKKPTVELGEYKGIKVPKLSNEVTENEINAQIEEILENSSVTEAKESGIIENGDIVVFDFEGFNNGVAFEGGKAEKHEMEIGSGQFIPGFEEQMVGMKLGEEKDINVTFPKEYHEQSLAGAPVVFKVKVHEINQVVKPELTDEFVASLGNDEKTVLELQTVVTNSLQYNKEINNKNQSIGFALNVLASNSKVEITDEIIEQEFNRAKQMVEEQAQQYGLDFQTYISLSGMTEEQFNESLKAESRHRILTSALIEEITKIEKFEVTNDEVNNKYVELSEQYNMPVEEIKQHLNDELIKIDIEFTKAVELIFDNLIFE